MALIDMEAALAKIVVPTRESLESLVVRWDELVESVHPNYLLS
jgi:hypothetical protein